jgi:penicillin amidase
LRSFRNEEWAWALLAAEPAHLLPPWFDDWSALRRNALVDMLDELGVQDTAGVAGLTWGAANTARVQHPLSRAVPALSQWLDMPPRALPGDGNMPRVQGVRFGASQRMAVSPGDEHNGYFHMPGGQSGHPRSPFYGAGHTDWEQGRPTPFMPGPVRHTLELVPAGVSPPSGD